MLQGPAIQGAVTPDARTNKEQFLIQADARTRVDRVPVAPGGGGGPGDGGEADAVVRR